MEFEDVVRRRRMVRRFTDEPVADDVLRRMAGLALRAPSAGFSQGWDFVLLRDTIARQRFWDATSRGGEPDAWLRGVSGAPVLVLCLSDRTTYLKRYADPDKGWSDEAESHWPVPYWDVDTAMAAMIMLLTAVDENLGALFFGVEVDRVEAVKRAFAIPDDRNIVGVIALGHPGDTRPSGSTRTRARRGIDEVWHESEFGRRLR